jgi:hypothetical protein
MWNGVITSSCQPCRKPEGWLHPESRQRGDGHTRARWQRGCLFVHGLQT